MKTLSTMWAVLLVLPFVAFATTPPFTVIKTHVMNKAYRMQIPFIENKGQVGSDEVSFYAKTFGGTVIVGKDGTLNKQFKLTYLGGSKKSKRW